VSSQECNKSKLGANREKWRSNKKRYFGVKYCFPIVTQNTQCQLVTCSQVSPHPLTLVFQTDIFSFKERWYFYLIQEFDLFSCAFLFQFDKKM